MATDVRNRRPARKTGPRAAWKTGFYYTRGTPPRPAPRGPRRPPAKKTAPGRGRPSAGDPGRADPGGGPLGAADPRRGGPQARRTPGGRTPGGEPRAGGTDPGPGGEPRRAAPARPRPGPDLRGRGDRISTNLSLETAPWSFTNFREIQGWGVYHPNKEKSRVIAAVCIGGYL